MLYIFSSIPLYIDMMLLEVHCSKYDILTSNEMYKNYSFWLHYSSKSDYMPLTYTVTHHKI